MTAVLKYSPLAVRIFVAGGAGYGTVKYGIWSDSSKSREKLDQIKHSVQREIEYPKGGSSLASMVSNSYIPVLRVVSE